MKFLALIISLSMAINAFSQEDNEIPGFMGDWQGSFTDQKGDADLVGRVIGLGNNIYRIQLIPEFDKRAVAYIDLEANANNGRIVFKTPDWEGEISVEGFEGFKIEGNKKREFLLKHIIRTSPTLGSLPPDDAIVLFDGSNLDEWIHPGSPNEEVVWKIVDEYMEISPGIKKTNGKREKNDLLTKRNFTDVELHLEFCLPYQPEKKDQGRCNSGVFLQDFYEIQILDSYGLNGMWNECGALYKMSPPKVNMCFPPGQWQTYDIIYNSPEFDGARNKTKNAFITVMHNGVLIHNQTEMIHPTAHLQSKRKTDDAPFEPAPLMLQDHNNPVKFRNIWIRELNN